MKPRGPLTSARDTFPCLASSRLPPCTQGNQVRMSKQCAFIRAQSVPSSPFTETRWFSVNACVRIVPPHLTRKFDRLWKVILTTVAFYLDVFCFFLVNCQLVDCLRPPMVITADDALTCQAVTPSTPTELSSVRGSVSIEGRWKREGRIHRSKGQREDLAECLRGV